MKEREIPYKIYLEESEMPTQWYNVRADMKNKPAPLLNPGTLKPMGYEDLRPVFCDELIKQELDDTTPYIDIPQEIRDFYKMYRPSPLVRAYCLEKKLDTPAKIYYKFEGNNTSGSHKLNSAIAQAYYAKKQGLKGVTTETGAGQWGTALSMACSYFDLDCRVYMVKVSYEQKPFRREVMRTYGAPVTPSPSTTTEVGRKILEKHPGTSGSLGCAISEAVESAVQSGGAKRYVLGSVLNQVLLHQSIIGLESRQAMELLDEYPDAFVMIDSKQYSVRNYQRTLEDYAQYREISIKAGIEHTLKQIIPEIYNSAMYPGTALLYKFPAYIYSLWQGYTTEELNDIAEFCQTNKIMAVTIYRDYWSEEVQKIFDERDILVYIYTINDKEEARRYLANGAQGVCTDVLITDNLN